MDAKDLRTEAAQGDRSNDGNTKYVQGGGSVPCHRNKTYQDLTSNSLAKVDTPLARPCAVIGPDRVVPPAPPAHTDVYYKKGLHEPWLTPENTYRRPPEYPHKLLDYQHPSRNISPRQTFQENMQRIMVAPSYNSGKLKEDQNYPGESNISQMRSNKLPVPPESNSKYCDVSYTVNPVSNEHKNVRNSDISVSNMNSVLSRSLPHGWTPTSANIPPSKPLPQDLCQYPEYQNCPAPRPVVMTRPHRPHEEARTIYPEGFYHSGNIRFKPYPTVKERYPQTRYEYIGNYSNPFHPPPPFPTHKYDLQKPVPPHPYPSYQQVPLKYLDNRMTESIMNGYQRSINQPAAYSGMNYRNQVMHPSYGSVPGSCLPPNKFYPYPPDPTKALSSNKLPFESNNKLYSDYEQNHINKNFSVSDTFYINEIARPHPTKGPVMPPNYPSNLHAMPTHPYYRKEPIKGYEYSPHFRNMDHMLGMNGNLMSRFPSQFSPNTIPISPSDSNASNETNLTHPVSQEDCGYVSQSSTASVRSIDSVINKIPHDMYRRYDHSYGHIMKGPAPFTRIDQSANVNIRSKKEKKDIDVRQFLQMWNEGEEETGESNIKEVNKQSPNNANVNTVSCGATNQEQLYVLGLVNVPSEELSKYQHIQKVSKLPENIKGYNSIELLHQFEEVIESSNLNRYIDKPTTKSFQNTFKSSNLNDLHGISIPSRPLSPLDVEAKISQSVIHKEVGCNFEIKPCSPKMLNVEVATPVQTVIGERMIEKVSNPLISHSPVLQNAKENRDDCKVVKTQDHLSHHDNTKNASCKMVSKLYGNKDLVDSLKTNYSIQDLESNSGVCFASLPRLDNDIELNFPEVNQQFINANKVDSVITTSSIKDLPSLDIDQANHNNHEQETDTFNPHMKRLSEKDSSKLSKYRKIKRRISGSSTPESIVQALRTDSVIIKNPDNCKHEQFEKIISPRSISPRTISQEAQKDPINLSVNNEYCLKSNAFDFNLNKSICNELAIDFSINANDSSNFPNDLTLPVISPAENTQACILKNEEKSNIHKNNEDASEDLNHESNILNEHDIKKIHESKQNDMNSTDFSQEPSVPTIISDETVDSKELERIKSEKVEIQNTNFDNMQLYVETDKETLNKKISSYDLLSSQEKEDTINERMRELFGEEFSTAETEPDLEEEHNTQAILDDDTSREKDCVFSDESTQQNDELSIPCNVSNQKEEKNNLSEDLIMHDLPDTEKYNKLSLENSPNKETNIDNEVHKHSKIINETDVKEIEEATIKVKENSTDEYIKNCTEEQNSPKVHLCRLKKELLSPWIQNLIFYDEGLYRITNAIVSGSYHADNQINVKTCNKINKSLDECVNNETIPNSESTTTKQQVTSDDCTRNENATVLNVLKEREISKMQGSNEGSNDIVSKNIYLEESCEILHSSTNKYLGITSGIQENQTNCIKLENDVMVVDMCKQERNNDTLNIISHQNDRLSTECPKTVKQHSYIDDKQKFNGDELKTDAVDIPEITEEIKNETVNRFDTEVSIVNPLNKSSANSKMMSIDNGTSENPKDSDPLKNDHMNNLPVLGKTISSEIREKDFADISDLSLYPSKVGNSINTIVNDESDKYVTYNKPENASYNQTLEVNSHETEDKLKSNDTENTFEFAANKKRKPCRAPKNLNTEKDEKLQQTAADALIASDKKESYLDVECILDKVPADERTDYIKGVFIKSKISSDVSENVSKNTVIEDTKSNYVINDHNNMLGREILDSNDVTENKTNEMQVLSNFHMDNDLNFQKDNAFDIPDAQLIKESEKKLLSKSPQSCEVQQDKACANDHELYSKQMSQLMDSSTGNSLQRNIQCLGIDIKDSNMKEIQCDSDVNYCKNSEPYNARLRIGNEKEINSTDSSESGQSLSEERTSQIEKQCETILTENLISHSEDFMTSSQDYYLSNEPIHTVFEQGTTQSPMIEDQNPDVNSCQIEITKDKQAVSEDLNKDEAAMTILSINQNSDESFQTDIIDKLSVSVDVSNKDEVGLKILSTNQTESALEEPTSCSDLSDVTSSSDDEDSSDSTDSNEFFVNKEIVETYEGDNKNEIHLSEENDSFSTAEESDSLTFMNSNNNVERRNDTEIESNATSNKILTDNDNAEIERDCIVEETTCEEYAIDTFTDFDEPIMLPETDIRKNEAEQTKIDCSKIVKIDDSGIEESHGDSDFILETSQNEAKLEDIVEDGYDEVQLPDNCKSIRCRTGKKRKCLKRSLSDSALDEIRDSFTEDPAVWPSKRKKDIEMNNFNTSQLIAQNICRVLQSNRRNSISSIHNEGNVSFCILIDNNCLISEECGEDEKICFSEVPEDFVACEQTEPGNENSIEEVTSLEQDSDCVYSTSIPTTEEDKILDEPWVDVACVETVISDDIAENIVISASASPKDEECNDEDTEIYNINEHTEKLKFIYGDKMYSDDAHLVNTLYLTPQMNVNKTLCNRESQVSLDDSRYYDKESLEKILSESNFQEQSTDSIALRPTSPLLSPVISELSPNYDENIISENENLLASGKSMLENEEYYINQTNHEEYKEFLNRKKIDDMARCESIVDVYNYDKSEDSHIGTISSSPEVSSTTSEEKNSGLLLKISGYSGVVSEVNKFNPIQSISCKYTEKKEYLSSNSNLPTRKLITKAAQKYIPPIKESINLKVKLPLPHQSLVKLRQLKMAKEALKPNIDRSSNTYLKNIPKKSKPKFEDVLKSIDELQYQKHKEEKNKKGRKSIPKVVIKKNVLGSHYASTSSKHQFNPDLTGRKWQPWVFLERDHFIDKMALRNKTRAIFSHRKQSYVLAEKFQKYKSVFSPKFVISQPKQNDSTTTGQLKYTIRLKHTY